MSIKNVDFKFENILDMISPKKVMDDIRLLRKELSFVYEKHEVLREGDPKRLELGDRLNVLFEEASDNYSNVMAMLPIAIEDIKTRLLLADSSGNDGTKLVLGTLQIGDKGELKVIEAPKERPESTALALLEDKSRQGLISVLEEDYEAVSEDESSDYIRSLVVRTFAPMTVGGGGMELNVAQEVENYNSYLQFYKESQESFIKCVRPLIEKMLGVRTFFEQYTLKKQGMKPTLLITNIRPEMLAKSNNITRLISYLNSVNGKNDYDNTIWYGIMPGIALDRKNEVKLKRQRFEGTKEEKNSEVNSLESLARISDVCSPYRIQMFFSFESSPKCTFDFMATEGIEIYETRCQALLNKPYSEFLVPCLPNLTIIPKDKSGVILDSKMVVKGGDGEEVAALSKDEEDIAKLWIEGVYVGAAYLAAGITAAWQDPAFLKEYFRKRVAPDLPGVRFDIEADDHALMIQTTMPKEITGFTSSVKADINSRNFGFIFSSENAKINGKQVNRITVYKARSLLMDEQLNTYEPAYKTLHTTYIDRMLRFMTLDYKEDNIIRFFSNNPASQKSKWAERREFYNSILEVGDDLSYEIDGVSKVCNVNIMYKGNVKNLEVDISRSLAAGNAG
jgi:hypothetical protein